MKVIFMSQADKDNAIRVAEAAPLEACGELYRNMLKEGVLEGQAPVAPTPEEPMVDDSIEQIQL